MMPGSTVTKALTALGLGLQIPYLAYEGIGLAEFGPTWIVQLSVSWEFAVVRILGLALSIAVPVLAGSSMRARSRKAMIRRLDGAFVSLVLSLGLALLSVRLYAAEYGAEFDFVDTMISVLGFGDYTGLSYGELLRTSLLASLLGGVFLVVAAVVARVEPERPGADLEPGWYPHPSGLVKYWNGRGWFDSYRG
jgi:hypothetical protein